MFESVAGTAALLEELADAELQAGQAYLRQLQALQALTDVCVQVDAQQRSWSDVSATEHALAEAALVLRLSSLTVDARLLPAQLVTDHPLVADLLAAGAVTAAHVVVLAEELDPLDTDLAARALSRLLLTDPEHPGCAGTPGELRRAARRVVVQLDPEGAAERRHRASRTSSGVRYRALQDGLAALGATGAAASLKAARGLVARLAEAADTEDDERTHGQREVDALLGALLLAARSRDLPAADLELQIEVPVQVTDTRPTGPCTPPEPAVIRSDLTPELLAHLLAGSADHDPDPTSRLRRDEAVSDPAHQDASAGARSPARLAAVSDPAHQDAAAGARSPARPAAVSDPAHQEAAAGARSPARPAALSDPTYEEAAPGARSPAPPAASAPEGLPATAPPAGPVAGPAAATTPAATSATSAPTAEPAPVADMLGHGAVDPALLRELLTDPRGLPLGLRRVTVRRVCRDTTSGQVVAVDAWALPLERLAAATKAVRSGAPPRQPACRLLETLVDDLPTPAPLTLGYRPTAAQKRLVQARDVRCTFPGCGRPARQSQLDHLHAWPDGTTTVVNLHPLCQHHHRLKHDGWDVHRLCDGSTAWTSPAGQHVRAGPRHALGVDSTRGGGSTRPIGPAATSATTGRGAGQPSDQATAEATAQATSAASSRGATAPPSPATIRLTLDRLYTPVRSLVSQ